MTAVATAHTLFSHCVVTAATDDRWLDLAGGHGLLTPALGQVYPP